MNILTVVTIGFLILEAANVITLYFFPGSKYANGVGVFKAWEKSKGDPEIHNLIKYLVNWVAGTKLIFILLLIVILFTLDDENLVFMGIAMVISIASWGFHYPLSTYLDQVEQALAPGGRLILDLRRHQGQEQELAHRFEDCECIGSAWNDKAGRYRVSKHG